MKILVCGGRRYSNYQFVNSVLNDLHASRKITCLVHGDATGADALAKNWAVANNVTSKAYPANWNHDGKAAGPIRNQKMLDINTDIEVVVAFDGGTGTADMVRRAKKAGIEVKEAAEYGYVDRG